MALAEAVDVEARLGRPLTEAELVRIPGLLGEASALVEGYCGRIFLPDVVPDAVVLVVAKLAARGLSAEADTPEVASTQFASGPHSWQQSYAGDGSRMWIGSSERLMLKPYRVAMRSIALRSEQAIGVDPVAGDTF